MSEIKWIDPECGVGPVTQDEDGTIRATWYLRGDTLIRFEQYNLEPQYEWMVRYPEMYRNYDWIVRYPIHVRFTI